MKLGTETVDYGTLRDVLNHDKAAKVANTGMTFDFETIDLATGSVYSYKARSRTLGDGGLEYVFTRHDNPTPDCLIGSYICRPGKKPMWRR